MAGVSRLPIISGAQQRYFKKRKGNDIMKGYRTLAFNLLVAAGGVIVAFDWSSVLPPQYVGYAAIAISVINMGLRAVTDTAMGQKS